MKVERKKNNKAEREAEPQESCGRKESQRRKNRKISAK